MHITEVSWSSHTACKPVRTTIPEILGTAENASHGATETGGRFQPHFRGPDQQHQLNPACEIGGTPTFVEIDDVFVSRAPNRSAGPPPRAFACARPTRARLPGR